MRQHKKRAVGRATGLGYGLRGISGASSDRIKGPILELLHEYPTGFTLEELVIMLEIEEEKILKSLKRKQSMGEVYLVDGFWKATPKAK